LSNYGLFLESALVQNLVYFCTFCRLAYFCPLFQAGIKHISSSLLLGEKT
jgi:hypothetical protein